LSKHTLFLKGIIETDEFYIKAGLNRYCLSMVQHFTEIRKSCVRWEPGHFFFDPQFLTPDKWTYLFDHTPLVKTLEKYVDFNKLQPNGNSNTRLIITAVNVLTAEYCTYTPLQESFSCQKVCFLLVLT